MEETAATPESGKSRPLRQDEIEFLLAKLNASMDAAKVAEQLALSTALFNFSSSGNISNDQMRAIGTVNDAVARSLTHTGGAWLRTEFQVSLDYCRQMPFLDFIAHAMREDSRERCHLSVLRLEPLGAMGVLELGLELAPPIVDVLLGGTGKSEAPRMLTEIEEQIILSLIAMVLKEMNTAWHAMGLQFVLEQRESQAHVSRLLPVGEKTVAISFQVSMPEAQGSLKLCLPAVVLNTLLRKSVAERDRPRRRSDDVRTRVRELVGEATVGSVLQFPPVRISAREIAQLTPGHILRLPVPRHAPAELRVGGLPLGRARAVKMGEHRGACMEPLSSNETAAAKEGHA